MMTFQFGKVGKCHLVCPASEKCDKPQSPNGSLQNEGINFHHERWDHILNQKSIFKQADRVHRGIFITGRCECEGLSELPLLHELLTLFGDSLHEATVSHFRFLWVKATHHLQYYFVWAAWELPQRTEAKRTGSSGEKKLCNAHTQGTLSHLTSLLNGLFCGISVKH